MVQHEAQRFRLRAVSAVAIVGALCLFAAMGMTGCESEPQAAQGGAPEQFEEVSDRVQEDTEGGEPHAPAAAEPVASPSA